MSAFDVALAAAVAGSASLLGLFGAAAVRAAGRPRVLALMYHRVAPREAWERLRGTERVFTVAREDFEAQIAELEHRGWTFVGPDEVAEFARGERSLADRSVLLTVDDGCVSAHREILPVLARRAATAILFVTTDPGSAIFRLGEGERRVTDDEIRELARAGVEIGSHAVSHRALSTLSDGEIRRELAESKRELERVLDRTVRHFAVPANWFDERVLRIAREEGYTAVWCSRPDGVRAGTGAYGLPRVNIEGGMSLAGFRRAISPAGIAQRGVVMALRGLPKRLVGPRGWSWLRGRVLARVPGHWLSPRRMAMATGFLVASSVALSLVWWLVRAG